MSDEPVVSAAPEGTPTPEPAPDTTPAPADSAPASAEGKASEKVPVKAPDEPGGYPVAAPEKAAEHVARSTYNGQSFDMSQAQLDELVYRGLSAIEAQGDPNKQPAPAATPQEEPNEMAQLKTEMAGLKQTIHNQSYETRVQNETARINTSLDAEILKHEVFKDNESIANLGRKSALALLNHNPRMTEVDAMKQVANDFGSAFNAKKEQWIKDKVKDASSAEAGPGGAASGTPSPSKMTGKDLRMGRVMDAAMKRVASKDIFT